MKSLFAFTIFVSFLGAGCFAEEPLSFKVWKDREIVQAQYEIQRINALLRRPKALSKAGKADSDQEALLSSARFERAPDVTERDLRSAQESLALAKQLTLQEYAEIYVSNLQQNPEQFVKLMDSLSKDEMSQIMKILVKNKTLESSDAKHNGNGSPPPPTAMASHS